MRLVRASAWRSRRWKSLGDMMAGEKKRRHRKLVTAMNGTFWRGAESGWNPPSVGSCQTPFHPLLNDPGPYSYWGPLALPSSRPPWQGANLVLGVREALAHALKQLAKGGADNSWACANRAAESAQERPQVSPQRLRTLL